MPRCPPGTRRCTPNVGKCHKTGKTGKLQTVYQWSDDMKKCFESK